MQSSEYVRKDFVCDVLHVYRIFFFKIQLLGVILKTKSWFFFPSNFELSKASTYVRSFFLYDFGTFPVIVKSKIVKHTLVSLVPWPLSWI